MTIVVLVSVAVLAYTYFGYPIAIALLARVWPYRPRQNLAATPSVTAIIPVYNAAEFVAAKLDSLLAQDYPAEALEILVYSDGSDDDSDAIVADYAARDPRIRLLRSPERLGKPTGVNRMLAEASGEVLLMTDIRQPLAPGSVRALVAMLDDPQVGCVSGNLRLLGKGGAGMYWKYENAIRTAEGRFRSMVGVTGPIYAIRKADMSELPGDVILDDMWVPMRLRLRRRRILMCKEAIAYDQAFADEREFSRKTRTLAGNYQLFARMPGLLIPFVNPSWFETFSHKLLRLVGPWALVVLFVATLIVNLSPDPAWSNTALWEIRVLAIGQGIFYLAALLGPRFGPIASLARTFVVLNVAAVVGLWRFLRRRQKVTW